MTNYVEQLLDGVVQEMKAVQSEISALRTNEAVNAEKRKSLEHHLQECKARIDRIQEWVHSKTPIVDRLAEEARDLRRRKNDLVWKVIGFVVIGAVAAFTGWFFGRGA